MTFDAKAWDNLVKDALEKATPVGITYREYLDGTATAEWSGGAVFFKFSPKEWTEFSRKLRFTGVAAFPFRRSDVRRLED